MFSRYDLASDSLNWTSSPLSSYSNASPLLTAHLSLDDVHGVAELSEAEYDALAERGDWQANQQMGNWPTSKTPAQHDLPPWALPDRVSDRKGSIISISSRSSLNSPSRLGTPKRTFRLASLNRKGSEASLLGSDLASPVRSRRRSSKMSLSTNPNNVVRRGSELSYVSQISSAVTDPEREAEDYQRLRSIGELGRRFSDVVEIIPASPETSSSSSESEEDRDFTPDVLPGRRNAQVLWSPDTSEDQTDDDSEVQSLPQIPTPEIPQPGPNILSNFPLMSEAVDPLSQVRVDDFALSSLSSPDFSQRQIQRPVPRGTPSPELAPAEFLRRLRAPFVSRPTSTQILTKNSLPVAPPLRRARSSPLFISSTGNNRLVRRISISSFAPVVDIAITKSVKRRSALIPQEDDLPQDEVEVNDSLNINSPTLQNPAQTDVILSTLEEPRKTSFSDAVQDFGFLASEITVERYDEQSVTTPTTHTARTSPVNKGNLSAQVTPRFDPMAAFLGKHTPTPSFSQLEGGKDYFTIQPVTAVLPEDTPLASETTPKVRPVSLQVLPLRVLPSVQHVSHRARPRSGGLAISNSGLPTGMESASKWSQHWADGSRFPSEETTTGHRSSRSVTAPVHSPNAGQPHRIIRKAVPSMPTDYAQLSPMQRQVSTPSASMCSPYSPAETNNEQDLEARRRKRAARRKCRRCEEKRALRILVEAAKLSQTDGRSPGSDGTETERAHHEHGHRSHHHSHSQSHHLQSLSPPVSSNGRFPSTYSSPLDFSTVAPVSSGHYQQHISLNQTRPPVVSRESQTSSIQSSPSGQQKVTYAPEPNKNRTASQSHSAPRESGVSRPILISSTSSWAVVQEAIHQGVQPTSPPIPPTSRPSLLRSASTSMTGRVNKSKTFSRILHAFDSKKPLAPGQISKRESMYQLGKAGMDRRPTSGPVTDSDRARVEMFKYLRTKGSMTSPPLGEEPEMIAGRFRSAVV